MQKLLRMLQKPIPQKEASASGSGSDDDITDVTDSEKEENKPKAKHTKPSPKTNKKKQSSQTPQKSGLFFSKSTLVLSWILMTTCQYCIISFFRKNKKFEEAGGE